MEIVNDMTIILVVIWMNIKDLYLQGSRISIIYVMSYNFATHHTINALINQLLLLL